MSDPAPPLSGSQVVEIIASQRAKNLGIRLAPRPTCFAIVGTSASGKAQACGHAVYVHSYVLTRPDEGECRRAEGGCGAEWKDATPPPYCGQCGWSKDHREGYGCDPNGEPDDAQPFTQGVM